MVRTLSNSEKQQLYRLRQDGDPARREAYLAKKRQNYRKDVAEQKRKSIKDLTDQEKRHQRKQWRKNQRACRAAKSKGPLTPPVSPENEHPSSR